MSDITQVSFEVEDVGKKNSKSKKNITWKFAIGEEIHTVNFVWSKLSGKRVVKDEIEVLNDSEKSCFLFHKWKSGDKNESSALLSEESCLDLQILACMHSPEKDKLKRNFVKYELIVNGKPFSRLPHKDGSTLPELKGPGPHSIFDVIYPQGYENEVQGRTGAPFARRLSTRRDLNKEVRRISSRISESAAKEASAGAEVKH